MLYDNICSVGSLHRHSSLTEQCIRARINCCLGRTCE